MASRIPKIGFKKKPSEPTFRDPQVVRDPNRRMPHEFDPTFNRPVLEPALRRRSKSVSDLKVDKNKKVNAANINPVMAAKGRENSDPKTAAATKKRPAATSTIASQDAKSKRPRIPEWDYKSRFANLQERFTNLQKDHKSDKEKLTNYDAIMEELDKLRPMVPKLEQERNSLREANKELRNKLKNHKHLKTILLKLKEERDCLRDVNNQLDKELKLVKEKLSTLEISNKTLLEDHKQKIDENGRLTSENAQLECELNVLRPQHDYLQNTLESSSKEISRLNEQRRELHNTVQDLKGTIRVYCRFRPAITVEEKKKVLCDVIFHDDTSLEIRKTRASVAAGQTGELKSDFSFDKVFTPYMTQSDVFQDVSQLVQSALDGYNVCVFAYGQTGSGKTHTMLGSPNDCGVIPRTVHFIFEIINKLKLADWEYTVRASFMEIYNENLQDLLSKTPTNCEIKYNEGNGVIVTNLTTKDITSSDQLINLISEANRNRAVAATDFNEHSSRSHAITKIYLNGINNVNKVTYVGSLNLVDLAGSESAKTSRDVRLAETKNINKSLSALADVMLAIYNNDSHVPYRNSKLTFLLQSCLGGNSKTLMLVNLSPFEDCYNETISSLRFATKVKEVRLIAKKNFM